MNYELKDKISVNKDFLADLESRSWQEIEHLQGQITNIDQSNKKLLQLFKNLLTSYYVFVGGLENLADDPLETDTVLPAEPVVVKAPQVDKVNTEPVVTTKNELDDYSTSDAELLDDTDIEPFEYFVDFDEPIGEPLSDEDLYGN